MFNTDQPRDINGQWTAEEADSARQKIKDAPKLSAPSMSLYSQTGGFIDRKVFPHPVKMVADRLDLVLGKQELTKEETVDFAGLKTNQRWFDDYQANQLVDKMAGGKYSEEPSQSDKDYPSLDRHLPFVVKYNGEKYLVDGNHRIIAAKALGVTRMKMRTLTLPTDALKFIEDNKI